MFHIFSNSKTPQRPDSAAFVARQESEEIQKLQLMIQRQAEQISSLIATVNSQVSKRQNSLESVDFGLIY